jgi:hypothetical protein
VWRYGSTHSLTSALGGDELLASRPGHFIPRKGAQSRYGCDGEEKIRSTLQESNRRTSIVQPVAECYTGSSGYMNGKEINLNELLYHEINCDITIK